MDKERYKQLDTTGMGLTEEEIAAGWHFCSEMDELLCQAGSPDCHCILSDYFDSVAQKYREMDV